MSGTTIPMGGVAPDVVGQIGKWNAANLTSAQTGQAIAQTGLIGQQTQAANIQNQISSARLPFLMNAYGQGGAPAGGAAPGGAPGAIGASGEQNWTGPDGIIPAPGTPFAAVGAMPKSTYTEAILSPNEKWSDVAANLRTQKNAYVNQAVAATIDPSTGQADPTKWNQMVQDEVQSGWMDAVNARKLYGHPELAQTLLNSTLPAGEQPGTKQATAAATAAGTATQELTKINVPVLDANGQPTGQTQEQYFRKSDLTAGGQPKPGAQNAAYGPPVQATELPSVAQNFLRALSPSEANSANQRYVPPGSGRSATFDTSQGHPGQGAAGLFQFEPETWARGAQLAGVDPKDMSQANQERVAWAVAQDDYANNSGGKSLTYDLNHGNYGQVAQGLKTTWPSITGGSQQNAIGQSFVSRLAAIQGGGQPAAGGTAAPAGVGAAGGAGTTPAAAGSVGAAGPPAFTPGVAASREVDTPLIKADTDTVQANLEAAQKANVATAGIREARDLIGNVPSGAFIDQRMQLQSIAKQTGSPLLNGLSTALTGLNSTQLNDAEFARKLYQANVVKEEQGVGNVRIGAMFTNFFAKASPNLSLQNGALNEMTNAALVGQQMTRDFANGSNEYLQNGLAQYQRGLTGGTYQPWSNSRVANYESTWTAAGSPHAADTYAAAVHILNGADITQAFKGLNPAQRNEAIGVIQRADPGSVPAILKRPDVIEYRKQLAAAPAPAAAPAQ
jgi:hypothetical protein